MRRLPSVRQLQYLAALYHAQHFGKAAEACFISQSTLSASIAQLEEILNAKLLERDHKNFIFTALGEAIVKKSEALLDSLEELTDFAKNQSQPMTGILRLGCIPTIASFILSDVVLKTREQYPKLQLRIIEDTTEHLLTSLQTGVIDAVLLALPYQTFPFEFEILAKDPLKLVMHKDWVNQGLTQNIAAWPEESIFLLDREHCLTNHALVECAVKDKEKIHPFFATSIFTLTQLVNSQIGITFLPKMAIDRGILNHTSLVALDPVPKHAHRKIALVWRATSTRKATSKILGGIIKEILSASYET